MLSRSVPVGRGRGRFPVLAPTAAFVGQARNQSGRSSSTLAPATFRSAASLAAISPSSACLFTCALGAEQASSAAAAAAFTSSSDSSLARSLVVVLSFARRPVQLQRLGDGQVRGSNRTHDAEMFAHSGPEDLMPANSRLSLKETVMSNMDELTELFNQRGCGEQERADLREVRRKWKNRVRERRDDQKGD